MKTSLRYLVSSLILLPLYMVAQQIAAPGDVWRINETTYLENGHRFLLNGSFEISKTQIQFFQKQGKVKYDFRILSVAVTDSTGAKEFTVDFRGVTGKISIWQEQGGNFLTIAMGKDNQRILPYMFNLTQVD